MHIFAGIVVDLRLDSRTTGARTETTRRRTRDPRQHYSTDMRPTALSTPATRCLPAPAPVGPVVVGKLGETLGLRKCASFADAATGGKTWDFSDGC